ncbi:MAG TPA: TraM recognition domain-containing protein [bacterium]|nr:TraM recognition domain-containing protein [bacterium]
MSNDSKLSFNQIIWMVLTPPLFFLVIDLLRYLAGFDGSSSFIGNIPLNVIRPPMFLFLLSCLPYPTAFYFRHSDKIFFITKVAISLSVAIDLLEYVAPEYGLPYWVGLSLLTILGTWGLVWKADVGRKPDAGPYPLTVDKAGRKGFPTDSLHMNVQIVGGTGTGKTHFVIKPFIEQTIHQGLGCFVFDVKGNLRRDVAYYLKTSSYSGRKGLLYFDVDDPRGSDTYNPLYGSNPDAIANRVFTALYYDNTRTEPYYVELGKAFLHNLVGLLKKEIKTLTFLDLLLATEETDTFRTIHWFCAKHPDTPYARYFRNQWLTKPGKQRQEELSGLVTKLQRFCNSEWAHLLNVRDPNIRMEDVVKNDRIFLFSPNAAKYPDDAKPLSILAMMDLSEQVADRYRNRPEKPFRVFLDEFYNLAYPRFIDFINKCREAKVNLFLAHQSLGDLSGISQEFLEQVMNTARNKIVLGVDDPATAEHFARQFGTELDQDYQVESFKSDGTMAGYSKPKVEKFRFHPNLIKALRPGAAIVKVVGTAGVHIFEASLRPASPVPETYEPGASHFRRSGGLVNESSLEEVMKPKPWDKPQERKDGGMGDENAA